MLKDGLLHLLPESSDIRHLNALFYLYQTKSIFSSTSIHWCLTFYIVFEKPIQMATRLHNFCKEIVHRYLHTRLYRKFAHFQIFLNTNLGFKIFENVQIWIRWVKAFLKMYSLLPFWQFFWHNFCFITRFRNKYLNFYKFAIFLQIIELEPKGFPKT